MEWNTSGDLIFVFLFSVKDLGCVRAGERSQGQDAGAGGTYYLAGFRERQLDPSWEGLCSLWAGRGLSSPMRRSNEEEKYDLMRW